MISSLRASHHLPLRRFFCKNSAPDMARYREVFARKMAMAGLKPHHRIALGVSGGPDSIALCVLTAGWKSEGLVRSNESPGFIDGLLGIIVDHRLRPESKEEAKMVQDRVSKMGIECEIAGCDWSDGRPKQGHLQEAAREMRYQIFEGICIDQRIGVLLIAHHADDQVELFILRLSRGSGVFGLAGMASSSQLFPKCIHYCGENSGNHGILLVRPMLDFTKEDMYKICQGGHQEFVEDPTNQSPLFARNRIRISLKSLISSVFKSEMQILISACRLTRSFVEHICHEMIKQSVTIVDHGYAIIDLKKLEPSKVVDLCLSRFLALVLQFISQRHRPIRGSVSQLLLDYIRNHPCKTSLTAAGCYLCAAPGSKGTKILVCCSLDSHQSSRIGLSFRYSCEEQQPSLPSEIDQIIMDAKSYSVRSVPEASAVPFLHVKSSDTVLSEAKKLNLISESTYTSILFLRMEESKSFSTKTEVKPDYETMQEMKSASSSSIPLHPGLSCHFMSRFLVTWKRHKNIRKDRFSPGVHGFNQDSEGNWDNLCQFCMVDQEKAVAIRHMVDADWLYLANVSKRQTLEDCQDRAVSSACNMEQNAVSAVQSSRYMQLSAQMALQALKCIPVAARRALPVLVDSHGLLLSIPSICFRRCPCLSVVAVFKPRVPLGGGYSSYI